MAGARQCAFVSNPLWLRVPRQWRSTGRKFAGTRLPNGLLTEARTIEVRSFYSPVDYRNLPHAQPARLP